MTKLLNRQCWLAACALFALGCGQGANERQALTGQVTLGGQPVKYGQIYFDPDTTKGHSGPQGAGEIRDGHFETNPGYGPKPGPYVVRITGWMRGPDDGMLGEPAVSDYQFRIEIPSGENKPLDFAIPAQAEASGG